MDEWERQFANKSENRRRRSHRRRLVNRAMVIACISLAILAGLWLVDQVTSGIMGHSAIWPGG